MCSVIEIRPSTQKQHTLQLISNTMPESFSINFNNYQENLSQSFKAAREFEYFHDVTLACDDGQINAHKLLLFTGSEFFQKMLPRFKNPNPFIYLKGLKVRDLEMILDFVYYGEVRIQADDLTSVLNVAKDLEIKGFSQIYDNGPKPKSDDDTSTVSKKLDDLLSTISEAMGSRDEASVLSTISSETKDLEEEILQSKEENEDIDTKVLELMERTVTGESKVSWNCTKCDFHSNDKTRTRRHVRAIHVRGESSLVKTEFDAEDLAALELMERELTDEGRVVWKCLKCEFSCNDKCRTRKHVKSKHVKKPHLASLDDSLSKSLGKVELEVEDLEALDQMTRELGEEGKVRWSCQTCEFSSSDKTRTRRHVKARHIKRPEQDLSLDLSVSKVELDEEDQAALQLMARLKTEEGGKVWQCTVCDRQHFDKTRIRKHIKKTHV